VNQGVRYGGGNYRPVTIAAARSVTRWDNAGAVRGAFRPETGSPKYGRPAGYRHPQAWLLPQKPGTLGSFRVAAGTGGVATASPVSGKNGTATITGTGDIPTALAKLVVAAASTIAGSGVITTADAQAFLNMAATLAADGDLTGAIEAIGHAVAALAGTGTLDHEDHLGASAQGYMDADITPFTDLSPQSLAAAVWGSAEGAFLYALAHNRIVTDPVAGTFTVYDDDGITPLYTADLWQDAAGATPYAGSGADRRDAFA